MDPGFGRERQPVETWAVFTRDPDTDVWWGDLSTPVPAWGHLRVAVRAWSLPPGEHTWVVRMVEPLEPVQIGDRTLVTHYAKGIATTLRWIPMRQSHKNTRRVCLTITTWNGKPCTGTVALLSLEWASSESSTSERK